MTLSPTGRVKNFRNQFISSSSVIYTGTSHDMSLFLIRRAVVFDGDSKKFRWLLHLTPNKYIIKTSTEWTRYRFLYFTIHTKIYHITRWYQCIIKAISISILTPNSSVFIVIGMQQNVCVWNYVKSILLCYCVGCII